MRDNYIENYENRYKKLGGWLLVFVIIAFLFVLSNIVSLFSRTAFLREWADYSGGLFVLKLLIQFCDFYAIGMGLCYAIMIIVREPRFMLFWQLNYIGTFVKLTLRMMEHLIFGYPDQSELAPHVVFASGIIVDILSYLPFIIVFILFNRYYSRSERVYTYMDSGEHLKRAAFTKKAQRWFAYSQAKRAENAGPGEAST